MSLFKEFNFFSRFDTIIIFSSLIIGILESSIELIRREFLSIILILRLLRLFILLKQIKRFRDVITTMISIIPSLVIYATLIFTVYYVFSMIGMEIYSYKINNSNAYCGNIKLINSTFAELNYCKLNFNTFPNTLVLMFVLMVVNQWSIIASGYVLVTSKWSRIYFVLFHSTCVVVCLK